MRWIPRTGDRIAAVGGPSARAALKVASLHGTDLKTRVPRPARGVIPRPRLESLRELVRARPLTLVTAPPGYGKTSVALAWAQALASEGARVAWLHLGSEDDEAGRFMGLLAAALDRAGRGGDSAASALPWSPGDLSIPARQRVSWLLERLSHGTDDVVLFIDDAHELRDAAALQALSTLLRFAGDDFHLVLLARTEVPLDVAALRAHDGVFELHGQALCFDVAETDLLLRKARPDGVDADEAAQLQGYTGGWVAALRAALLTQRLAPPPLPGAGSPALAQRRPPLKALQPLFAELLEHLPEATRRFVEAVTVTRRIHGELAEALSGLPDAAERLDLLERQQVFVGAFDDDGWTGFHPLFREFVQSRVAPERLRELHRRAARWLADHGMWAVAIEHALAGQATTQALGWIEKHAMALVGAGDLLTLLGWERQLRVHLVQSPLRLRLAFAWALSLCMACDRALVLLDGVEAEHAEQPEGPHSAALRDECLALRAVIVATTGDHELAAELAAGVGSHAEASPWVANAVRNVAAAACLHAGRWEQLHAAPSLVGDGGHGVRPGDAMSIDYRLSILGLAEYRQGHLDDAAELLESAMSQQRHRGSRGAQGAQRLVLAALPAPTLALVRYEQNRVVEAARINAEHFDVNRRMAPIEGLFGAYLVAARVARLEGHAIRARHLLDEGESIGAARGWRRVVVALRLEKLRLCLLDGRTAEAGACVEGIAALAAPGAGRQRLESGDFAHAAAVARGWRELAEGSASRAAELLCAEQGHAATCGRLLDEISLGTGHALARLACGQRREAMAAFAAACRSAAKFGALRSILDQPVSLQPLLDEWALRRGEIGSDAALDALVERLRAATRSRAAGHGAPSPIETLSPRELHILERVAEGQSNKEIARGLGIAPETVKTHVSKIFGKLGAGNRAQAAAMLAHA